MFINSISFL